MSDLLLVTAQTNPRDPRNHAAIDASFALFAIPRTSGPSGILEESLDGVDRAQLYPAIRALLQHQDSVARGSVARIFQKLTDSDIVELLPDIQRCAEKIAPSNEMYADPSILSGLDLLSNLHISEGMELCVASFQPERWGEKNRVLACPTYLKRYGSRAKEALPRLQEIRAYLVTHKKVPADYLADFDKAVAEIENSTAAPSLVKLKEFESRSKVSR